MGRFSSRFKIGRRLRAALADVSRRSYSVRAGTENRHRIFASFDERFGIYRGFDFGDLGVCRTFPKGDAIRKTALVSFIFIITEALVGAGLVLTGNTAETLTAARPFWMIGHLTNTFILLAFLTLTAWFASGGKTFNLKNAPPKVLLFLAIALLGIFSIGMSGSVAALSSMLFPSATIAEGVTKDFSATSNILLRLRISHPILSIITSVFLIFLAGWLRREAKEDVWVLRFSNLLSILILIQIAFGALTLLTLAPILMQLGHLFLADAVWIAFVLLSASFLAENQYSER